MTFRSFNTFPYSEEEFIDVIFVLFGSFFIEWVRNLIFFDVNEDKSNGLDNCENEVLSSIIPLFFDLSTEIKESSFKVDHRMPYFTHEIDFWRSSGEIIKGELKLVLGILVKSIPDKYNSMPYWIRKTIYFRGCWVGAWYKYRTVKNRGEEVC